MHQVGKSLVIKSLIKHYTRQSVSEVKGPITVVSGKQRRLTFVECPQVRAPDRLFSISQISAISYRSYDVKVEH